MVFDLGFKGLGFRDTKGPHIDFDRCEEDLCHTASPQKGTPLLFRSPRVCFADDLKPSSANYFNQDTLEHVSMQTSKFEMGCSVQGFELWRGA